MTVRDDRGDVKQTTTGFRGPLMVQSLTSAKSKFLSLGIIEAASFKKYVINLGDRQKGRCAGDNIFDIRIEKDVILETVEKTNSLGEYLGGNIYKGEIAASQQIIDVLKQI